MVSRPELGSDPPFGSGRETGRDTKCIVNMWVHPKNLINLTQRKAHWPYKYPEI